MNQNLEEIKEATIEVLDAELNFCQHLHGLLCRLEVNNPYKVTTIEALSELITAKEQLVDRLRR